MKGVTKVSASSREEWLALRKKYIGGSDAAAVVGLNPYSSAYALWAQKTGKVSNFAGNLATEVGTYLENFVAEHFAAETGKRIRKCKQSILNPSYPFAIANIDREIVGEDAGLEIKTTDSLNMKRFKNGEYPESYYVQCVHYMAVTKKSRWYLAVLIGNHDFRWYCIERDQAEIDALMHAEADFWKYVTENTPPPLDGSKATEEAIAKLYPQGEEEETELFDCAEDVKKYMELTGRIKELQALKDEAANRIKACMGDASNGFRDGYHVTWKNQTRSAFDRKKLQSEHPELDLSRYLTESSCRVFKVMENE